ncbi:Fe-Mn family superoxide dismutase [Buchnera aphidicola (Kurisakia onigurumii)]|uniref:Fe-Mn family superoxide dismutase n=1 Tax=Buchnera aphidicola TaxID=9 RepID=UPI0031B676BF
MQYYLPKINYAYNALEPFIDAETMFIHHTKHHQAYIDNTNRILKEEKIYSNISIEKLLKSLHKIKSNNTVLLQNNAGGHFNHSFFWKLLKIGTTVSGNLKQQIKKNFQSIDNFKLEFEKKSMQHFGSGWIFLVFKKGKLSINSYKNQDNPLMSSSITGFSGYPILCLDLWEHAYYLKYRNRKLDYIQSFWNILNWEEAMIQFEKFYYSDKL